MRPDTDLCRRTGGRPAPRRGRHGRLVFLAVVLLPLLTTGCVKQGISAKSADVHRLFFVILWLAVPVFVFVEGMLLVSIVRFRRRRGDDTEPSQFAGSRRALTTFFVAPLAVIAVLLGFGETALARVDHNARPAERLVITGFQWAWSAHYVNENITVTGRTLKQTMSMALPVNKATRIELRSNDVMHEFYVPDLLYMRNAVPGHPNVFTVTPTKLGTYQGQCAQFCGLWHSKMALEVKVLTGDAFHSWLAEQEAAGPGGAATCAPKGSTAKLVASQISWDTNCVAVAAGAPFQITINNQDKGIAHNFAVYDNAKLGQRLYLSVDVTGPDTKTFTVPTLPAGTYYFQCDIHGPAMSGTLIVR